MLNSPVCYFVQALLIGPLLTSASSSLRTCILRASRGHLGVGVGVIKKRTARIYRTEQDTRAVHERITPRRLTLIRAGRRLERKERLSQVTHTWDIKQRVNFNAFGQEGYQQWERCQSGTT